MKKHKITKYSIKIQKPGIKAGNVKLLFLSDMHNCKWGDNNRELFDCIDKENADVILCGGDMLVAHPNETVDDAVRFMTELSKRQHIYYALGNHEYRLLIYPETYGDMYDRYMSQISKLDIELLDNKSTSINIRGIDLEIFGLSIEKKYYKRFTRLDMPVEYIESLIGRPDNEKVNILLAHTPKYMNKYFEWGADVSLSGHYHGGVMGLGSHRGLVSPDPQFFPYNAHGCFYKDGKASVISAGIGEHTIPFRLNNPRELVSIDLIINRD